MGLGWGVLGQLQVLVDGLAVPLGSRKQRAVLAVLVLNRNQVVTADSLVDAVWEHGLPSDARASLHTYVFNLRRALAGAGVADARDVLAGVPPGYKLTAADGDCDLGRFSRAKSTGIQAAAAGRFEQASEHLAAALAEWRGPFLSDLRDFQFVEAFAAALLEDKMIVHTARAQAEIACGRSYAVVGDLEALTAEHPYREPLWAELITAYYLADRQADALEAYRRVKALLADDFGIDPGPALRDLFVRVLRQEPLDVKRVAATTAANAIRGLDRHTSADERSAVAGLRSPSGQYYPLLLVATRIGRSPENDIVLEDASVSRQHAVIVDTGSSFVIADLRSANGVQVQCKRIRPSATLTDGDHIAICDHEFTFEITAGVPSDDPT
jgi:DNA-binding SARP family transcriptional activator